MRIEPLRSSLSHAFVSPTQPQSDVTPIDHARTKRDSLVVDLTTQQIATRLIRAGDTALCALYSAALMDQVIADPTGKTRSRETRVISDIPPFSTFGRAWAQLAHAIQSEPFAGFARQHKIDPSTLILNTQSGWTLDCIADGQPRSFSKYSAGYEQATAAVTAAARAFHSPPRTTLKYTGANLAPAEVIGNFYGARQDATPADVLHSIALLQQNDAFDALREPDAKAPAFNRPAYSHIRQQQREAIEEVAGEIALKPELLSASQHAPTPSVAEADRQMARMYGSALLSLRPEMARFGNGPRTGFLMSEIPEHSTLGQTLRNTSVPPGKDAQISLAWITSFYAEPGNDDTLVGVLAQASRLTRNGFQALNASTPPTDMRSRAVQQRQRAAIQKLKAPNATPPTESAPPPDTPNPPVNPLAAIARRQFAGEPNLYSVVARLLSERIKQAAPALDVDVNQIAIEMPDVDNPGALKRIPLMTLALDYLAGGDAPSLTASHRAFDTRPDLLARTGNAGDVPLALDPSALSDVIGSLPAQLNQAFEADSREYWDKQAFSAPTNADSVFTGSHRDVVKRILRSNLQLASLKQPGLDEAQRETIDMVVRHPEGSTRPAPLDPNSSGATVYTLAGSTANMVIHRYLADSNRAILLLVEPSGKITPYNTWDAIEKTQAVRQALDGNLFDAQADALIKHAQGDSLLTPPPGTNNPTHTTNPLPDWLDSADEAQRFVMHELSQGLASFLQRHKGQAYNSDIKDIRTFAQQRFDLLPPNKHLTPHAAEDLEVVFKVPYGTQRSGFIDRQTMSLTDMLLNNLSGLPNGQIEVFFKTGLKDENGDEIKVRVPALEKEGVLKQLITDLDIGKTYPALLKEKLLDNPTEMAERRSLFAQQVPIELQLKALELSIKKQAGFNATGFRYIQEILKPGPGPRIVDAKEIVIRPLAFDNKAQGTTDVVEGAYLIEPKDSTSGPHILYRPLMADAPLLQFPTRQALLEALQQPGKLQNDTLAWLPDETTRQLYRGNGFKHPNLVIFGFNLGSVSANETIPLAVDTRLQQTLQDGKLMEYLYEANAQNLITLAGQHSTSDAKSRWQSLKTGGFLLLNALLPALRGPGAILGLALQAEGIINDLETLRDDDSKNKQAALTDLLVNLATLLIHFKARSLSEPSNTHSAIPITEGTRLIDGAVPPTPPPQRFRMGGPLEQITPLDGEIQTNVDTYNRKGQEVKRLNIIGHAADPEGEQAARIVGEGDKLYTAEDINNELIARGIDIRNYAEVRLLVCYSSKGGENSLAAQLHALTGVPVKGYERTVELGYATRDGGIDPEDIYKTALNKFRAKYPRFSEADKKELAEIELNNKLKDIDLFINVEKKTGKKVRVNWGTLAAPIWEEVEVDYRPKRFGPPKRRLATGPVDVQSTSKELRNIGEYKDFKELPTPEKLANSIAFTTSDDGQYEYFLDRPEGSKEVRLNIVGHGDKGGATFKSDLKGAQSYSPEAFAKLIAPTLKNTGATQIRMVSCRSASTGFSEALSKLLNVPVKAPVGTVTQFEVMKDRYWILEKFPNPRRPHDHEWKTFTPTSPAA